MICWSELWRSPIFAFVPSLLIMSLVLLAETPSSYLAVIQIVLFLLALFLFISGLSAALVAARERRKGVGDAERRRRGLRKRSRCSSRWSP